MQLGNHDAADRLLVERAQLRADMGALNHPYRVYDYVAQALNRSMAGEFSLALRILQDAPRLPALASAGDLSDRLKTAIDVARARVLTDSGDREAAWKLVQDIDPAAPVWDGMRSRYATFAELVCSRGKALEGKKVFEALLESAAKYNDPSSPELGWLRAHTGLCAFESRDVFSARLAANAAREIFRAQPRVSSYYKLPLAKLDSLLAVNSGSVAPAPKN